MTLLLTTLGVLVAGGVLALAAGKNPKVCTALGAGSAVAAGVLGLIPVLEALARGTTTSFRRDWGVPYGSFTIELDSLSAVFLIPVLVLSALAAISGSHSLLADRARKSPAAAWFFFNIMTAAMVMVALARNGVLFLVAWEVMSLASYFLVTHEHDREEVREAGRTYLIATHVGTAFLLVFFVLLGNRSSSLDFHDLAGVISPESTGILFVLALVGFGTKAGFMPLHVWLPDAYSVAPDHVPVVMSGAMSKLGIYGLIRALTLLPTPPVWCGWVMIGVGIISGVWGILYALAQDDLKRLLAYSSIENVGIIALGVGTGLIGLSSRTPLLAALGFTGALLHVLNHAAYKGLLFLGAGVVGQATGTREIDLLGGLGKRMPGVAAAFLVGTVAIMGLPPLNGFVSEYLIYRAAFREEMFLGVASAVPALGVIASLALIGGLAAVGFTKLFGLVFLGEPRSSAAVVEHRPSALMVGPMYVLAACCVLIPLRAASVASALMPAVAVVIRQETRAVEGGPAGVIAPLSTLSLVLVALFFLVGALALVRGALLKGREIGAAGTWGCGYARPTPRIQYTGSSYVQPAVDFFRPFLRTRKKLVAPTGLFPKESSLATETPDLTQKRIYRPVFEACDWALSRLRWLQRGHVHVYVLYIAATTVALLAWYLGMGGG